MQLFASMLDPFCGSTLKYSRMLGATPIDRTDIPKLPRDAVVMVPGDAHTHWMQCHEHGVPYIVDQHDVYSLRHGDDALDDERRMLEGASAVIFTSGIHRDWCAARYDLPYSEVAHLRPALSDLDFTPLPRREGTLVYAGGIQPKSAQGNMFGYRCYHEIFEAVQRCGYEVHVYPAYGHRQSTRIEYENMGVVWHDALSEDAMYAELSQYAIGLHGYGIHGAQRYVATCMPNKAWLYLGSGIPTLGHNAGASGEVYDGRWGIVARDMSCVGDALAEASQLRITDTMRREQTIESDAGVFERLRAAVEGAARYATWARGRVGAPITPPDATPIRGGVAVR